MDYKFSRHAKEEIVRRDISVQVVESILVSPQQVVLDATGKRVFQSKVEFQPGKIYLVGIEQIRRLSSRSIGPASSRSIGGNREN